MGDVGTLVLLRHGQSTWNAENLFTGWVDVPLSELGEKEARRGGQLLADAGLLPDLVHTSLLRRAISTAHLALDAADRHWIPVRRDWRLNERHYGALQGKDKAAVRAEFGDEQFMLWRRSYDVPPPQLPDDDEFSQANDPRYGDLLESRGTVGLRGAGFTYDGFYYVKSVSHAISKGKYKQRFSLSREGTGALTPVVLT